MFAPRDVVGQRSETVRRSNLSAIVRAVHLRGPLSRSELVAAHRPDAFRDPRPDRRARQRRAADGDAQRPDGAPGRPSPLVHPDPDGASVVALEINVDSLAAARVGPRRHDRRARPGRSTPRARHPRRDRHRPRRARRAGARLGPRRRAGRHRCGRRRGRPHVETASSGSHRTWGGPTSRSATASRRRFDRTRRSRSPTRRTSAGWPSIVAGPRSARRTSSTWRARSAWAATSPSDGQPLDGAAGYAGEVGHMVVNPGGAACACGSFGCWETEIGERAMLVRAGRSPAAGARRWTSSSARPWPGSRRPAPSVAHVGTWLGVGIASLVNIFDPTLVVLGGVLGRIHPLVAPELEAALDRHALSAARELVRVVPGALGVERADHRRGRACLRTDARRSGEAPRRRASAPSAAGERL